ncbi:MAG: ATP-binding protein [Candidatus Acidiferrum sp.]
MSLLTLAEDWLVGGGEMGKLIRSKDWSRTPLGPIERWPQSLRTSVSLCVASNFPIALIWGPEFVQIYNDGYWRICGGKHPQSMGQNFKECWETAWPEVGEAFEKASEGETCYRENERMFLDRNGFLEETCFTHSFSPIRDEEGKLAGVFHPVTEITSNMLSERRTRGLRDLARSARAQSMEEACALAVLTLGECSLDLPFVLFYLFDDSRNGARLVAKAGLLEESAACVPTLDLAAAQPRDWPLTEIAKSSEPRYFDDLEARFGHIACTSYPESVKAAVALAISPPGCAEPVGILVAGVSPRLALNESYRAFYDLLAAGVTSVIANARAYEVETKRAEGLAEIDRVKTTFFSNVSHEFRTPLTLMLGPLEDELAERVAPLPPARHERLKTAHRNSMRLLKLVNTLLDFSRIEAGRMHANYEATDLSAHTADLASAFRSAIEKAGLVLTIDCPPLPAMVYVDREMWEKIVLNLLSNAVKHTFTGAITVKLQWCGDWVELAVSDTGVGIPEAALPLLFQRFHRVKGAEARTHEGSGIGLALVHELVLLHGGTVRVESKEQQGSTFTVRINSGSGHLAECHAEVKNATALTSSAIGAAAYVEEALQWLPREAVPLDPLSARAISPSTGAPLASGVRRARILWADDNADMRDYVRRLLADKYEVTAVANGLMTLSAAQENPPDLILSDVMMPGMDGLELVRQLRSHARTRAIPVILLSARARQESAIEGLEMGADDYIAKPFTAKELLARVHTHLEIARVRGEWAKELERTNKELEAFSSAVSHDLRTPLRHIDWFSKSTLDKHGDNLGEEGRGLIKRIRGESQKMSSLIDALLDLSRIAPGPLRRKATDLTELSRKATQELREQYPSREVAIEIADGLTARGDVRLISIALSNLLGNAWKFTSKLPNGQITVGQVNAGSEVAFFVRDNGAGFDMAQTGRLFIPFRRLHSATEFEGSGIGLATVQRIIARHGGHIWATSEVGKGATFFFTLSPP